MSGLLSRLFRRRRSLLALATDHEPDEFISALLSAELIMLASLSHDGLPLVSVTEDALLQATERAAQELTERKTFSPFTYVDEGNSLMPFFTSQTAADAFCGAYCERENRLFQFQAFILGADKLAAFATPGTAVVMDPQTDNEFTITEKQLEALRSAGAPPTTTSAHDVSEVPSSARRLLVPAPFVDKPFEFEP